MIRIIICLLLISGVAKSSYCDPHEYWIAFLKPVIRTNTDTPEFKLQIVANNSGKVTIEMPAVNYKTTIDLVSGEATFFMPPVGLITSYKYEAPELTGIVVKADFDLQIVAASLLHNSSDAASIFPLERLGSHYLINTYSNEKNRDRSSFIVVATSDQTKVNITLTDTSVNGTLPRHPQVVTLNRGECYRVTATGDLSGSEIIAQEGKAIAVFAGAELAAIPDLSCDGYDQLYDEIPNINILGTEYLMSNGHADIREIVRIVFTQNNTILYYNGQYAGHYNKGDRYEVTASTAHIKATAPVLVCEYMIGSSCTNSLYGDPSMMVAPPLTEMHKLQLYIDPIPLKSTANEEFYALGLYAGSLETDRINLNDNPVSGLQPFRNDSQYSYTKDVVDTPSFLDANTPVIAKIYAFGSFESYLYCFSGWNFKPEPKGYVKAPGIQVKVGPVPSVSEIKIFISGPRTESDELTYSLFDPAGRQIASNILIEGDEQAIPTSILSAGLYYVKVLNNNSLLGTYKIIYGGGIVQ